MLTLDKYEGKTEEELINHALEDLNTCEENLFTSFTTTEGGLFKGKKVLLTVTSKDKVIQEVKQFLKELGTHLNLDIHSEIKIEDKYINILLVCENNSILIGKDGKNLDALQTLIRQFLSNLSIFDIRVAVDVSNYKDKKKKNLEYEIKKLCKEVLKSKVEVKLDPMNSYERRVVHTVVGEFEQLESTSYGEGKDRYTVIKYKD